MLSRHSYGIWLPVRASLACSSLHPLPDWRLATCLSTAHGLACLRYDSIEFTQRPVVIAKGRSKKVDFGCYRVRQTCCPCL